MVTLGYRRPTADDIEAMAAFAAGLQDDPDFHIPYLGTEATSIATDIGDLTKWTETSTVVERDGRMVGWLVADVDLDMGRTWWWGPFASDDGWDEIADGLYRRTRSLLPAGMSEEEACADDRSEPMRRWCRRHGFHPDPASVLLRREPGPGDPPPRDRPTGLAVRPLTEADHPAVMALHELAFPGTHTTPGALVVSEHPRTVAEIDGSVAGYVAYEMQSDGSGYIDYVAVDEARRGNRLGGALVEHACEHLFGDGAAFVHLTVTEGNGPARAMYRRLGFVEDRLARPYRLGFRLP